MSQSTAPSRPLAALLAGALAVLLLALAAPAGAVEILSFDSANTDEAGEPFTQAGGRAHRNVTSFLLPTSEDAGGNPVAEVNVESVEVDLPPGLIGNPLAYPRCTAAQLSEETCPANSQLGMARLVASDLSTANAPLYNMAIAAPGRPAQFGFSAAGFVPVLVHPEVHADGSLTMVSRGVSQLAPTTGVTTEFWGVPSDPAHDEERRGPGCEEGCASGVDPDRPFLALPTHCGEAQSTDLRLTAWQEPGLVSTASAPMPANSGCKDLVFEPTLSAHPTTNVADSPSGFEVDLEVPQAEDAAKPATPHLKDAVLTLPRGLTVNAASANGLDGCSPEEVGIDPDTGVPAEGPAECPDASKIATVAVDTPLIDHPIPGSVYLADPFHNPFDSLIAIYIALNDPATGIFVKLAGEVSLGPDGQITTRFADNPPVPFTNFHLEFFGGAAAPLKTPSACGTYTTTSALTPYSAPASGPPARPADSWRIASSPLGGDCPGSEAELPHSPGFDAGSALPLAAHHTPLVVNLRRADGTQRFRDVTLSPPPCLVAKLAGVPYCPEAALAAAAGREGRAEQADPSCPAASRLGSVWAAAGAGPDPYWAPGTAYLAGPYKGAPLSIAILAPAVAGPFDLGVVAIRTALHLNPQTAQITAVADPIPAHLRGVPLDVRVASVRIERPGFALNGTSCEPTIFGGALVSTRGAIAPLASRFQLAECARLPFKPRVALRLRGKVRRGAYQALTAVVRPRPGDANIGRTVVRFPPSAFVAQEHIRTICTRVQFAANACPPGSVYGRALAWSPLLDYPLRGNVYLRSSDNALPDAVADLRGPAHQPLRFELAIRNDSVKGALRNTVGIVPDAPVSYFRLRLFGGRKGLIVNSRNVCKGANRAAVAMRAHNGRKAILRVPAANRKCKQVRRRAKRRAERRARRAAISTARRAG